MLEARRSGLSDRQSIVEAVATTGHVIMYGSNDILADFLETNPAYIRYLAQAKWIELPVIALNVFERKVSREVIRVDPGVYVRSSFNSHGDVVGHLGKTGLDPDRIPNHGVLIPNPASSTHAFEMMEAFHQTVLAKGGTVLFEFPSLRMRNCDSTGLETFNALLLALNAHTTIPVLSAPYDRCYPDEYFYDTAYHLTAVGRELRTQDLIESLSAFLIR